MVRSSDKDRHHRRRSRSRSRSRSAEPEKNDGGPRAGTARGTGTRDGIASEGVVREIGIVRGATEGSVPRGTRIVRENVETVKKSVLQARNPRALAKNDRTGLAHVIERIKRRGTMRNCRLITQSWTRRKSKRD